MIYYQATYTVLPTFDRSKRDALIEGVLHPCYEKVDKKHGVLKVLGIFETIVGDRSEVSCIFVFKDMEAFVKWRSESFVDPAGLPLLEVEKKEGALFSKVECKLMTSTEFDHIDWES